MLRMLLPCRVRLSRQYAFSARTSGGHTVKPRAARTSTPHSTHTPSSSHIVISNSIVPRSEALLLAITVAQTHTPLFAAQHRDHRLVGEAHVRGTRALVHTLRCVCVCLCVWIVHITRRLVLPSQTCARACAHETRPRRDDDFIRIGFPNTRRPDDPRVVCACDFALSSQLEAAAPPASLGIFAQASVPVCECVCLCLCCVY